MKSHFCDVSYCRLPLQIARMPHQPLPAARCSSIGAAAAVGYSSIPATDCADLIKGAEPLNNALAAAKVETTATRRALQKIINRCK